MKRNYNTIAFFYDRLARLVYGKALVKAQLYLLKAIPAGAHILVAGGGTGWILEEIVKIHQTGLTIDYIDASSKMIALAKKRNVGDNKVNFITALIQDMQYGQEKYDVVLTPFLFDNFTDASLQKVFSDIDGRIKTGGLWLYCDFQDTGIWWQKIVLKIMYLFFRVSCGIEASQLPDAEVLFSGYRYQKAGQKTFKKNFIVTTVYKRER